MESLKDVLKRKQPEPPSAESLAYQREIAQSGMWTQTSPTARCPVCRGLLHVRPADADSLPITDPRFGQLIPCPACSRSTDRIAELYRQSRLLPEEQGSAFAFVWKSKPARGRALEMAKSVLQSGGWLTLWSRGYGCGKSYLGAALACEAIKAGRPAAFWLMTDLLEELKASWGRETKLEYESKPFEHALAVDVLVIDELEKIQFSDWSENRLEHLFLMRYRATQKVTAWITNEEPVQGNPRVPAGLDPLFSRMSQHLICEMTDGDIRPTIGDARRKEFERGAAVVFES